MGTIFTFGSDPTELARWLRAIATLVASQDFKVACRIMYTIALLVVTAEIMAGKWSAMVRPLLGVLIVIFCVEVTAPFSINNTNITNTATYSGVQLPVALGVPAALSSSFARNLTQLTETYGYSNSTLGANFKYSKSGVMFGESMLESAADYVFRDPIYLDNMKEFISNCVFYGLNPNIGWYDWASLLNSSDMWGYINNQGAGVGIFTPYTNAGAGTTDKFLRPCGEVLIDLNAERVNQSQAMLTHYATRTIPKRGTSTTYSALQRAQTTTLFSTYLRDSFDILLDVNTTASNIVMQSAMINAFDKAAQRQAVLSENEALLQEISLAQAKAQQRTTYNTLGALAKRTLPLIRTVLEAVIYGIFPIMVLFFLITPTLGKTVIFYLKSIIWLQLWPPLFSIFNVIMHGFAVKKMDAIASNVDPVNVSAPSLEPAFSIITQPGIVQASSDLTSLAGYLMWFIPAIAWGVVSAGGYAFASLAGSLGQPTQAAGSAAAGDASKGNVNLGSGGFQNNSAFQQNSAPSHKSGYGTMSNATTAASTTTTANGTQFTSSMSSNLGNVTAAASNSIQQTMSSKVASTQQSMKQSGSELSSSVSNTSSSIDSLSSMLSSGTASQSGVSLKDSMAFTKAKETSDSIASTYGEKYGISSSQASQLLSKVGAGAGVASVYKSGIRTGQASQAFDEGLQITSGEAWKDSQSSMQRASTDISQSATDQEVKQAASQVSNNFSKQTSAGELHRASSSQAEAAERAEALVSSSGFSSSANVAGQVMDQLTSDLGSVEAAEQAIANVSGNSSPAAAAQAMGQIQKAIDTVSDQLTDGMINQQASAQSASSDRASGLSQLGEDQGSSAVNEAAAAGQADISKAGVPKTVSGVNEDFGRDTQAEMYTDKLFMGVGQGNHKSGAEEQQKPVKEAVEELAGADGALSTVGDGAAHTMKNVVESLGDHADKIPQGGGK